MTTNAQNPSSFPPPFIDTFLKATPRLAVAGFAGYYSLGILYSIGFMERMDRIALAIIKHFVGYAGIGGVMPTYQWYAAYGVRIVSALAAALIYDLIERIALFAYHMLFKNVKPSEKQSKKLITG